MGVDLSLIPLEPDWPTADPEFYTYRVRLNLDRYRALYDLLRSCPSLPVDKPIRWLARNYLEPETTDTIGNPFRWVECRLITLAWEAYERDAELEGFPIKPETRAAFAYLSELPQGTRIVLDWH